MKPHKGYYSIIQYCPDRTRLESANIGVVLFCPERLYLQARTASNNERIIRFFGSKGHDWRKIRSIKVGIEERLQVEHSNISTVEDLQEFIDRRANQFRLTDPRPMRTRDPEEDLDGLFAELVGGTHRQQRAPSVKEQLAEALEQPSIRSKLHQSVEVTVPIDGRSLVVPYAFQNGRFNLIQPVRFRSENPTPTAYKYAVEGRSIYETTNECFGDMQLIVVGSFRSAEDESKSKIERILAENSVSLYSMTELDQLVHEILTTGTDVPSHKD